MAADWRERLRALKQRFGVARPDAPAASEAPPQKGSPVVINLGVDFGTRFTKVCFRDVGSEETEVVTFGGDTIETVMIPSVVEIGADGKLSLSTNTERDAATQVRYLKMRLAGDAISDEPPTWYGEDLRHGNGIEALASWFFAKVILDTKTWIRECRSERLKGRPVQWSANVGVPVEYYDSPMIETFERALFVGWSWAETDTAPPDFRSAYDRYQQDCLKFRAGTSDCHALPEIAAAVQSFVMSREAQPGIYIYFDIGGGTVDGVAFNYLNLDGERKVNFYSGKVRPLGISAIASRLCKENPMLVENLLVRGGSMATLGSKIKPIRQDVQRLTAEVIITAKRKDGRDWQQDAVQETLWPRHRLLKPEPSGMIPLPVFVGGGGAPSKWYRTSIESTHADFQHYNADIPPYRLQEVEKPDDLDMNGLSDDCFRRLAIAYGLSVPKGEGPEIGLPSQFEPVTKPVRRHPKGVVDYLDSKEVYD